MVILLFVLFQVFGTAYIQQRHQAQLREELAPSLHDPSLTTTVKGKLTPAPPHPAPSPGAPVATISIPKIGLNMVVVEGTGEASLELGPGHYSGTPLPGEAGNVAIAGHRTTWARPFYNLDAMRPGDPIFFTTPQGRFTYRTVRTIVVLPTDVAVLKPTVKPTLTLTTCNPRFSAATRMVLRARLVASSLTPRTKVTYPAPRSDLAVLVPTNPLPAILFGLLSFVLIAATMILAPRSHRFRWPLWAIGVLLSLIALTATFYVASPLLPANL